MNIHTFFIPVMGTGFSIDTPIKVAKYGISSVISLVDDTLIEQVRRYYCSILGEKYIEIQRYEEDSRARRITAYLNLVQRIVNKEFNKVKNSVFAPGSEITKYFELLPTDSPLKEIYKRMLNTHNPVEKNNLQEQLRQSMQAGEINVNIMTKLDKINFSKNGTPLPVEYSDALAALRGFAKSKLESAIVFSAGINRRLYSYAANFKDFFADETGFIKKRIILKVSDYRSALIQGCFFAKKGIWVSEYRIESGLNCGGHAFVSQGYLLGPVLEEFKRKRNELVAEISQIYKKALQASNKPIPKMPLKMLITAQGGIGTYKEDRFLRQYYNIDQTGWCTPFLLVPEATNVDRETLEKLCNAGEDDLYLSEVSPLNVLFNNLKNSPSECKKRERIKNNQAGSPCNKGHLVSNTEFTEYPICTASRQYQRLKLEQLKKLNLPEEEFKKRFNEIVNKSCLCHDLGASPLINYKLEDKNKVYTAICPGPNMAYFSKVSTLLDMVDHIYGRKNIMNADYRPHMFIKELQMYVEYFSREIEKIDSSAPTDKQISYFEKFANNLLEGINYYKKLFPLMKEETKEDKERILGILDKFEKQINHIIQKYSDLFPYSPNLSL